MDAIERAFADMTDWNAFERIACRVLNAEGYRVEPRGGSGDEGCDAIERGGTVFQFSLEQDAAGKLRRERKRFEASGGRPKEYVFVTSQALSSSAKTALEQSFQELGIALRTCDRSWLSAKVGSGDRHRTIREELLAANLIAAPDAIRFALRSPLRSSMVAAIEEGTSQAVADDRLLTARAFLKAREYRAAESLLRGVLLRPQLPRDQAFEAHLHLGNALYQQGGTTAAQHEWRRAIDTGHHSPLAAANLATVLLLADRDSEQAREIATAAIEREPRDAGLLNVMGLLEWESGHLEAAAEHFTKAHALDGRPEYLLNVWSVREDLGRGPATDDEVSEALGRHPSHKDLLLLKANQLVARFQETHDPSVLRRAAETIATPLAYYLPRLREHAVPQSFPALDHEWIACALNTQAATMYWTGDYAEAEALVGHALAFDDRPWLWFTLGQAAMAQGRPDQAISHYERAAAKGFDHVDLWVQLGNAHYICFRASRGGEHFAGAKAAYERASSTTLLALVNVAQLEWDTGAHEQAQETIRRVLAKHPDEPVAQCNAAIYASGAEPKAVLARDTY